MPLFNTEKGFFRAVRQGDKQTVEQYLKAGKDRWISLKDKIGDTALHIAAEHGQTAIARLLLDAGAEMNARNRYDFNPLTNAIVRNHNEIVALLLERGVSTAATARENPPLVTAVTSRNLQAVKLLLAAKADPDAGTPLLMAVQYQEKEATVQLIEAGAKLDAHNGNYLYAIHFAASAGLLDIAKIVLEKSIETLNLRDTHNGYTPLHWAVAQGHNQMAELLLERGARTDILSNDGKTPLELAYEKKNVAVIRVLEAVAKPAVAQQPALQTISAPAPQLAANDDSETWLRMGTSKVAHVGTYPALNRKLTEIFNFSSRERIIITENLRTGQENMSPPDSFDALAEDAVKQALAAFRALGGAADDETVLNPRGIKKPRLP